MNIAQGLLEKPVVVGGPMQEEFQRYPALVMDAIRGQLCFSPVPPGDKRAADHVELPKKEIPIDAVEDEFASMIAALEHGALTKAEVEGALKIADAGKFAEKIKAAVHETHEDNNWADEIEAAHQLSRLSVLAVTLIDRLQKSLLTVEPFTEIRFQLTGRARAVLAIGWEAMVKHGQFPLRPRGARRFVDLQKQPCGALHFVSASDLDAGYFYTMGIAQSPEAQALRTMDLAFGLDGELIVPGQAVSPIPPFLAMATRLFAASVPTSSNISEEVQSIPIRNFPHPAAIDDLAPVRGGLLKPAVRPSSPENLATDLRQQLSRYEQEQASGKKSDPLTRLEGADTFVLPAIGAVYDATGLSKREMIHAINTACQLDPELNKKRKLLAFYIDVESAGHDRVGVITSAVDAAAALGMRYVAVADDDEDSWLPNLLEYLEADELNDIADYADAKNVIVTDGRPVDPVYTAATAAQRIQSVYTTLSVDILKMGMWLCLDALTARKVWSEILSNPHIPKQMLLMPIGIVEPWNAFCDNRDPNRTPLAILDPYEKIKFMIEEAALLNMPSLLTDTRHKATWVLLGRRTPQDKPHPREKFVYDSATGEIIGRTPDSARPLLSWEQFMDCERRARKAGIILGQAGSVEISQLFDIISDTTYDAAREGKNPATAIWTAETERVLSTRASQEGRDLQAQRSAAVSPFLAIFNRGVESHARIDGWLRYLAGSGKPDPLRGQLAEMRQKLSSILDKCMTAQTTDGKAYKQAFAEFRTAYLEYHNLLRDNFGAVRQRVASKWS
ncbi:MAG: hypothetical protein LAP21_00075 [Acidobacteriia bacterium]|nr:hypothetical protein [Terriglobia bacterium]